MAKGELRIQHSSLASDLVLPIYGRQYNPGWIDFEVTDRTINKTLVSDFVAIKRSFSISYDRIYGDLFADILDLYLLKEDVTFVEVASDLTENSFTCRISFPESVRRDLESGEYGFQGFAFILDEV